jgi:phage FluMu protein Com
MPQIDMVVIPEPVPETRTVFVFEDCEGPGFQGKDEGKGSTTFRCGSCKWVILKDVGLQQFQSIAFKCPKCAAYNELPPFTQR